METNELYFLKIGKAKYSGFPQKVVDFINTVQLKDSNLWKKCIEVFNTNIDVYVSSHDYANNHIDCIEWGDKLDKYGEPEFDNECKEEEAKFILLIGG